MPTSRETSQTGDKIHWGDWFHLGPFGVPLKFDRNIKQLREWVIFRMSPATGTTQGKIQKESESSKPTDPSGLPEEAVDFLKH